MKKSELLKILEQYHDDQEIVVEADGGFDDPVVYVTAVRARRGQEFVSAHCSEYMHDADGGAGAVVLGTPAGLVRFH